MDWPVGCINYAVNLVRPVRQGHRKKVLFHLLSSGLVFEDLELAGRYREFVTQVPGLTSLSCDCLGIQTWLQRISARAQPLTPQHEGVIRAVLACCTMLGFHGKTFVTCAWKASTRSADAASNPAVSLAYRC